MIFYACLEKRMKRFIIEKGLSLFLKKKVNVLAGLEKDFAQVLPRNIITGLSSVVSWSSRNDCEEVYNLPKKSLMISPMYSANIHNFLPFRRIF